MFKLKNLALASLLGFSCTLANAGVEDIYAVQFSEDGKHLVTGGSGGISSQYDENFSGGIKLWDVNSGKLVRALGQQVHIQNIFGDDYGRVGNRKWGIQSFKDIVINGNFPDGKIYLLPSSLGKIESAGMELPDFFGGYVDLKSAETKRMTLSAPTTASKECGNSGTYEFVGPITASDNGRYAAVVVNTCKQDHDPRMPIAQYDSTLHVVDLSTQQITKTYSELDSGLYAIGISNNGERIAYVGRDNFAVLDVASGDKRVIETYKDSVYQIPRQFSTLYFNESASKLVSLHYIYDIETGKEETLNWPEKSAVTKGRTSGVEVAPDLSYFVLVKPKQSLITFGDDGLPRAYGKADRVFLVDTKTGTEKELALTDSRTEGKRCVTDISPDSRRVAVACAGGLIKVFDSASGNLVWEQRNVGFKRDELDRKLIHVKLPSTDGNYASLGE